MSRKAVKIRVANTSSAVIDFIIEPWADCWRLAAEGVLEVVLEGPDGEATTPEVAWSPTGLTLYGWPGSTYTVVPDYPPNTPTAWG